MSISDGLCNLDASMAKIDWLDVRFNMMVQQTDHNPNALPIRFLEASLVEKFGLYSYPSHDFQRDENVRLLKLDDNALSETVITIANLKGDESSVLVRLTSDNAELYSGDLLLFLDSLTPLITGGRFRVTRVDFAFDFEADYSQYFDLLCAFYGEKKMHYGVVESRDSSSVKQTTLYSHSDRSSRGKIPTLVRYYEKSKEMKQEGDVQRLEFEVHPSAVSKEYASVVFDWLLNGDKRKPLGTSKWCVDLLARFGAVTHFAGPFPRSRSSIEKSFLHMVKQYSKSFARLSESVDMTDFNKLMFDAWAANESSDIEDLVNEFIDSNKL